MDLLLTQYCSKPHCPHRACELEPHWQPPFTQQAQLWLRICDADDDVPWCRCEVAFTAFPLIVWDAPPLLLLLPLITSLLPLLFTRFSHSQTHPVDFRVHKSTWPERNMNERNQKEDEKRERDFINLNWNIYHRIDAFAFTCMCKNAHFKSSERNEEQQKRFARYAIIIKN